MHLSRPRLAVAAVALLTGLVPEGPLRAQHAFQPTGSYDPAVPTPQSVLGYAVGARFTPHHVVHRYFEALARTSDRVRLDTLGRTFEGREVLLLIITEPGQPAATRRDPARRRSARLPRSHVAGGHRRDRAAHARHGVAGLHRARQRGLGHGGVARDGLPARRRHRCPTRACCSTARSRSSTPSRIPDGHERHVQDVMRARSSWGVPSIRRARSAQQGSWPGARTSHYHVRPQPRLVHPLAPGDARAGRAASSPGGRTWRWTCTRWAPTARTSSRRRWRR